MSITSASATSSTTPLRRTGIKVVGDVPWGTHFCLFYDTKSDLLETAVSYCKAGLESGEFCLWVVAPPVTEEEACQALQQAVPDFDRYLLENSIEIVAAHDWYLQDGTFDLKRVIAGWNEKLARASAKGYAGVRVTGDTAWLERKYWSDFCEYEESLNGAVANQRLAVLCTYPLAACGAAEILDVVRTHQFAITHRKGEWDIIETSELKQAKAEIQKLNAELEERVTMRTVELTAANEELRRQMGERKRAEEALFEAQAELAHIARLTAMGEMAASIVHEVTQPLTGMVTNSNACLQWLTGAKPNLDKARSAVDRIVRDGNRASDVILGIRNLVKNTPPCKDPVDVNEIIRSTVALSVGEMRRKQVHLDTELSEKLPLALADRVQIQHVLLNLMMNAVDAMSTVTGRPRKLAILSGQTENPLAVRVIVRDNGVGLDPANVKRVFDAFFTTKPQGMGLGLSICRTIITAHGGELTLERNPDFGASLQFTLPAGTDTRQ